jgi:hypothetical protein
MFYQHLFDRLETAWGVLVVYPDLFIAAIAATAVGVWWLQSQLGKAEINGLNARIGTLEERLRLAGDKFQLLAEEKARLEEQVRRLDAQIEDKMPVYALVETSAAAVSALNRLDQLEKEVGASLAPASPPGQHGKSSR